MIQSAPQNTVIGWREWVTLPELMIPAIKVKVDTGARTSALHAFYLEPFTKNGIQKIRFQIHPLQKRTDITLTCIADIVDRRMVCDSGGHRELRYVIKTKIVLGKAVFEAEVTLTDRDSMQFRMLLGRTALAGNFLISPTLSYCTGPRLKNVYGLRNTRRTK